MSGLFDQSEIPTAAGWINVQINSYSLFPTFFQVQCSFHHFGTI